MLERNVRGCFLDPFKDNIFICFRAKNKFSCKRTRMKRSTNKYYSLFSFDRAYSQTSKVVSVMFCLVDCSVRWHWNDFCASNNLTLWSLKNLIATPVQTNLFILAYNPIMKLVLHWILTVLITRNFERSPWKLIESRFSVANQIMMMIFFSFFFLRSGKILTEGICRTLYNYAYLLLCCYSIILVKIPLHMSF